MFFQMPACRYWKNIFIGFPCKKLKVVVYPLYETLFKMNVPPFNDV